MDPSVKPEDDEEFVDSSSDSILSDDWQDLSKSDYAKVIFCNLYHDPDNGEVGCKFQITDNVHEDPCDYIGLLKVGEPQCLVAKMLSETECEEDGKLLRCVFAYEDLPSDLQDGFYQFQYITRDQEICGASTPFEIKQSQPSKEDSSDEDIVTENAENDFVLVQHILEKKNRMLEQLLEKFRTKNLALSSDVETLLETKSKLCQEKEDIIENLHQEILSLKTDSARKQSRMDIEIEDLKEKLKDREQAAASFEKELDIVAKVLTKCQTEKQSLQKEIQMLKHVVKEKESLPTPSEQRILLEQLDDQKFMIRALEDSKQLALKEMSDLSESLSKRTKVLNQTRCELATCKGKVKESESIIEKQNQDISVLREKTKDLAELVEEKEEKIKQQKEEISSLNKEVKGLVELMELTEAQMRKADRLLQAARRIGQPDQNIAEEDVKKLLMNAFTEAEKYITLVDKIVEKVDFTDKSQEKAFFELKIMFFVLLGKMKKPNECPNTKEPVVKKVQMKQEKPKKTSPRTLPSCEGHFSKVDISGSESKNPFIKHMIRLPVSITHDKEVQVLEDLLVSEEGTTASSPLTNHEACEEQINSLKRTIGSVSKLYFEFKHAVYNMGKELEKKDAVIQFISSEKVNLLKSELLLQETVKEHEARIAEAAELYKKQFVEIERLKKKLRHAQRHSSKAPTLKVIGYESSSTAEEISPLRMIEKAPPTKRPRKTALKTAEKTPSPKTGDRSPPTLKFLLKSYTKKAEKAKKAAKSPEKRMWYIDQVLTSDPDFVDQVKTSDPDVKEESSQEKCEASGSCTPSVVSEPPDDVNVKAEDVNQPETLNKLAFAFCSEYMKLNKGSPAGDLNENSVSNTEKPIPLRSISDSDTGEHVLRNSVLITEGDKKQNVAETIPSMVKRTNKNAFCIVVGESTSSPPLYPKLDEVEYASEPLNPDVGTVQLLLNEEITRVKNTSSTCENEEESYDIPCALCDMHFAVTSLSNVQLMDHMENAHRISMCPVCGQLFESAVPKKYLEIHVNEHFQ